MNTAVARAAALAAVVLLIPSSAHSAPPQGYLPLAGRDRGHISDLVLIYEGGTHRRKWDNSAFIPYVTYIDPRNGDERWLFDGFLFLELKDGRGVEYTYGFHLKPATQREWAWLLDRYFARGAGIDALDMAVGAAKKRIGAPPYLRKVVIALPEPIVSVARWGTSGGRSLDLSKAADRVEASAWFISSALERWRRLSPKNLELAGFYWLPEYGMRFRDVLPEVASIVHRRGYYFYWIPSWSRSLTDHWRELGFDYVWQQPNFFFHPDTVPFSRLDEACHYARSLGMGLELEVDRRLITAPEVFRPRFLAYLEAFSRNSAQSTASIAYYDGAGTFHDMYASRDPATRRLYDRLAAWIVERRSGTGRTRVRK